MLALGVGSVLGLATAGHAFTIITFDSTMEKVFDGDPAADGPSDTGDRPRYTVSDDGCFMVFTSSATNLAPSQIDGNVSSDVFLYQSCGAETVTLVSHVAPAIPTGPRAEGSDQPVISPDRTVRGLPQHRLRHRAADRATGRRRTFSCGIAWQTLSRWSATASGGPTEAG